MVRLRRLSSGALLLVIGGALVLASCAAPAPSASVPGSESATAVPSPSPTPSPTPTAAGFRMPTCAELIPLEMARIVLGESTQELLTEVDARELMTGPVAAETIGRAGQHSTCLWGIPESDGGFWVVVAELLPADRDALVAALEDAPSFRPLPIAADAAFVGETDTVLGPMGVGHAFDGPGWIAVRGSLTESGAADVLIAALAGMRSVQG